MQIVPHRHSIKEEKAVNVKTGKSTGFAQTSNAASEVAVQIAFLDPKNHNDVAMLAHKLWLKRGCPIGSDQEDWFRAENELKKRTVVVATASGGR
jgi:hypothetical protein